jgi:hydroxypyruvate isomerase
VRFRTGSSDFTPGCYPARMERRAFLKSAAAAAAVLPALPATAGQDPATPSAKGDFKLNYAPHFGMFKHHAGDDLVAQLEFARAEGFTAWEDNGMGHKSPEEQQRLGDAMQRLGLRMGVFVCNWNTAWNESFSSGRADMIQSFVDELKGAVETAKRCGATWMTAVTGKTSANQRQGFQDANAIEMLRRGAEVLEPHGLVMVLEPLNFRDHPGMFLERSDHAYMLCKAVQSPSVKVLFDIYHQAVSEGNLIPNIERCWDETGYFQIGDNPGRKEPTTGGVNYHGIFSRIRGRGFEGVLGMEHGNAGGGREGERAVIEAYRQCDDF